MHVPDGFLDTPTSLTTGAIAIGSVGLAMTRADAEIRRTGPALAGLTAAFVFAVQMVNFPVGAGTSGHLMGGALAAALVGPWTAVLCMAVVLIVQALLFADGGLTALGTNITLIAVVTVVVGYAVTRLLLHVLPKRSASVVPAAAIGGALSVPAAALVFVALYAAGGAVPIDVGALTWAMVGWHLLIGVGEGAITAAVLGAVVATRPDLVYASPARRTLLLVDADGTEREVDAGPISSSSPAGSTTRPLTVAAFVTLLVGGVVSLFASANPDGLEHVAQSLGFEGAALDSAVSHSPLADYAFAGIDGPLGASVAGVLGVSITVAIGWLVARLLRARSASTSSASAIGVPTR